MSRIGKRPIALAKGVTFKADGSLCTLKGPKGELQRQMPGGVTIKQEGAELVVERASDSKEHRTNHGTVRAQLANMAKGVAEGWVRELEINGVGYRAEVKGQDLNLQLGYSHPIAFPLPKAVAAKVDKNRIVLSSADKDLLGQTASKVRELRPPEPYKGKGVKYVEEHIRRKAGKAGAS